MFGKVIMIVIFVAVIWTAAGDIVRYFKELLKD